MYRRGIVSFIPGGLGIPSSSWWRIIIIFVFISMIRGRISIHFFTLMYYAILIIQLFYLIYMFLWYVEEKRNNTIFFLSRDDLPLQAE